MNQYALVKKRLKEDVIQISLLRQTECGLKESCGGNCAGCVQQPQGELLATASDPIGVQPGERVEVEPTTGHSIGLSLVVFALPCVFLGLGYLVGQALGLGGRGLGGNGRRGPAGGIPPGGAGQPVDHPAGGPGVCGCQTGDSLTGGCVRICAPPAGRTEMQGL